jgi:formylglycine-generating enzyme required for sulfatase activity
VYERPTPPPRPPIGGQRPLSRIDKISEAEIESQGFVPSPSFAVAFPIIDELARHFGELEKGESLQKFYFHYERSRVPRFHSVRFTPANATSESALDVDQVLATIQKTSAVGPVIMVPHFAADVTETLKAMSVQQTLPGRRVQWIDGNKLLNIDVYHRSRTAEFLGAVGSKGWLLHGMIGELDLTEAWFKDKFEFIRRIPSTLFLIEFAEANPKSLATDAVHSNDVCSAIGDFCRWIKDCQLAHQVIVGFPRILRTVTPFDDLVGRALDNSQGFLAADLFSEAYENRIDYFKQLTGTPPPSLLRSLLAANSNSLLHEIAHFLHADSDDDAIPRIQELGARDLLSLAGRLFRTGFYECAARLELYCQTSTFRDFDSFRKVSDLVDLELDLMPHARQNKPIFSIVEGFQRLPQSISREDSESGHTSLSAILTGKSGSGKTLGLLTLQHSWSLPPAWSRARSSSDDEVSDGEPSKKPSETSDEKDTAPFMIEGRHCPAWLPLYLRLSPGLLESHDFLAESLRLELERRGSLLTDSENQRIEYSRLGDLGYVRWVFSSRILLLIDGIDSLTDDQRRVVADKIRELRMSQPTLGLIVSLRNRLTFPSREHGADEMLADEVSVRAMHASMVKELLNRQRPQQDEMIATVKKCMRELHKPISRLLATPYIVDKFRHVFASRTDIARMKRMNLYDFMKAFVQFLRDRPGSEPTNDVFEWLEQLAYLQKTDPMAVPHGPSRHVEASQMGYIRSSTSPFEFEHDLLLDYFGALRIAEMIEEEQALEAIMRLASKSWSQWEELIRILVGLVWRRDRVLLVSIVKSLRRLDPCIALRALEELPRDAVAKIPEVQRLTSEVAADLETAPGESAPDEDADKVVKRRIRSARALGALDPRICDLDETLTTGMVELCDAPPEWTELMGFPDGPTSVLIGKYLVTNLEYARFVANEGYATKGRLFWPTGWDWRNDMNIECPLCWYNEELNKPNQPVVGVSLYEAVAYCRWLTARVSRSTGQNGERAEFHLPTEKFWSRAMGGDMADLCREIRPELEKFLVKESAIVDQRHLDLATDYFVVQFAAHQLLEPYHDVLQFGERMLKRGHLAPVGLFGANSNGCFDLFGHVWQWCDDWLPIVDTHTGSVHPDKRPSTGYENPNLSAVVKGGPVSIPSTDAAILIGGWADPHMRFHRIGFRICCTLQNKERV